MNKKALVGLAISSTALLGTGAYLLLQEPPPAAMVPISQSTYIPPGAREAQMAPVTFTEVTAQSGIDFRHDGGAFVKADGTDSRYMPESMGPGVVLFDYDNDRDLDVFVTNSLSFDPKQRADAAGRSAKLYRNDGGLRFTDVSQRSGVDLKGYGMGASAADYDGDGDRDLLYTSWGGMRLMRNRGDGTFTDVTASTGLRDVAWKDDKGRSGPAWPTGTAFFDADEDGLLDLFVGYYVQWSPEIDIFSTLDGKRKSYAKPDLYRGSTCRLFLQRKGRFVDVTEQNGIFKDTAKALGVALWDFNQDGKLDVVVANDTQPNFLFEAQGGGRFVERGLEAGIAYDENGATRAGMGIDVADTLNDSSAAIAIGNFSREPVSLFKMAAPGFFREASQQAGVAAPTYLSLSFGLAYADLDLDGWQDLVIANGHLEPNVQDVEAEVSYRQPLQLLGNDRQGRFVDWSNSAGDAITQPMVARGMAVGDLDEDGDVDLVVAENNGPLHLLRNDLDHLGRNYLRVSLKGSRTNVDAIGARIEVHSAGQVQTRVVRTGSSYLSQSELAQTFGLGERTSVDKVVVTWPDGASHIIEQPSVNSHLIVRVEHE